jgi:predicted TIM-barrel fold metal-dependent hydrolase
VLIVDSQVHIAPFEGGNWAEPPDEGLSLEERSTRTKEHFIPSLDQLRSAMERAGVNAAIIVPRSLPMDTVFDENYPPHYAVAAYPNQFALMLPFDPARERDYAGLDKAATSPEILGVRVAFPSAARKDSHLYVPEELIEEKTSWFWPELVSRGLPVAFNAPGKAEFIGRLASSYPTLRIIVDHLGVDGATQTNLPEDLRPGLGPILGLAKYDNVALKASGSVGTVSEEYPFPRLKEALREVIDAFGAERVFWGSDYSHSPYPMYRLVQFCVEELDFLNERELELLMGSALVRFLGWTALEHQV